MQKCIGWSGDVVDLPESGSFSADAHVAMQRTVIAKTGSILLRGRRGYVNWLVYDERPDALPPTV